jgi:predicted ABC-type transport system involved in lysophospholipase L1 biosynthesis ATPase subunit
VNAEIVLEIRDLTKDYRGLRPLRVRRLELRRGQSIAIVGLDQVAAEALVNVLTGAMTPDAGEVRMFGQSTMSITDGDAWLSSLDNFGILSARAVLLDQFTALQNLAVPFSLELNPIPPAIMARVLQLAREVGLTTDEIQRPVAALAPPARLRVHLGRAIALTPAVLLAEHPNAMAPGDSLNTFAADFGRLVADRHITALTLTADARFAADVAAEVLTLNPVTGELRRQAPWRRWF